MVIKKNVNVDRRQIVGHNDVKLMSGELNEKYVIFFFYC